MPKWLNPFSERLRKKMFKTKGIQVPFLRCNALLQQRVKTYRWTYYIFLGCSLIILLIPSVLISTQTIPIFTDELKKWDRFLFFVIFIIINFIFWVRVDRKTTIQIRHLAIFPLCPFGKYELLGLASITDPRTLVGAVLAITFILSTFPEIVPGIGMSLITILFYLSLEIWLLTAMLFLEKIINRARSLPYILGLIPMWVLWISIFYRNSAVIDWFPLSYLAGEAISSARMGLWPQFAAYGGLLMVMALIGVLVGILFMRQQLYFTK